MNKSKKNMYIFLSILVLFLLIMLSPLFNIKTVNVSGNRDIDTNEILRQINLTGDNGNIFTYNSSKYEKILSENAYFESVKIKKSFPNTINVTIDERIVSFYILYSNNTYLYMDNNGVVVDTKQFVSYNHPIIKGLMFDNFTIGKPLVVTNEEALIEAKNIVKTINRYDTYNTPVVIDVKNTNNIHIYVKNINIVFGNAQNIDLKVRRSIGAISAIDDDLKGYLYVDDIDRDAYFKIIT